MHFTYQEPTGDLQQGDILKITPDLRRVLEKVHPHYANHQDYKFMMALTQSCDLALRITGDCSARYITLAAVRPAKTALTREVAKHQRSFLERNSSVCSQEYRLYVSDFVTKLLNNNIPEYFYLSDDPDVGLQESHVVFLTLSIAVRASVLSGLRCRIQHDMFFHIQPQPWRIGNEKIHRDAYWRRA